MKTPIQALLLLFSLAFAQFASAQTASAPDAVTVVIQINLRPNVQAQAATAPMNDMRDLIKKQPGYLGGESLRNNNPSNAPAFVHVTHWASLKYWENVYQSPELSQFNATGLKSYTVVVSAFKSMH